MSGTADTFTPAQRVAFVQLVEGTGGGAALPGLAAAVAQSSVPVPVTTAHLLGLPDGATFAQAAARLQARWAAGLAGL